MFLNESRLASALSGRGYDVGMSPAVWGLVLTILVMVAIAVFILLFERRRAREIEHDLKRSVRRRGSRGRAGSGGTPAD